MTHVVESIAELKTAYLDEGIEPLALTLEADLEGDVHLVIRFRDRPGSTVARFPFDAFEDVTDDRTRLEQVLVEGNLGLLLSVRTDEEALLTDGPDGVRILYDHHMVDRKYGDSDTVAEYYSLSSNHLNDTQHTAWHLNDAYERNEHHLLLTDPDQ